MTVAELIEQLKTLPQDAEVTLIEDVHDGTEVEPNPHMRRDGTVLL